MRRRSLATVLAAAVLLSGCGYNQIQTLDEQVNSARGNIEAQLQRRSDLIPNLVRVAEEAGLRENAILRDITQARAGLQGALQRPGGTNPQELANADAQLTGALQRFNVVVEAYPNLKSNQNFLNLQDELTGTENRIAVSRTDYNGAVQTYNTAIRRFPTALTARATGARPREYFEVTNAAAREAPRVDFGRQNATAPGQAPAAATPPAAPTPK